MLRLFIISAGLLIFCGQSYAHRSGCHRWHSCPSDSGSYTCGDTGHCNYCPDNNYCEGGRPKTNKVIEKEIKQQSSGEYSCSDNKKYCGEMHNCAEARFYLKECGLNRLDGDKDGVPCEKLCR